MIFNAISATRTPESGAAGGIRGRPLDLADPGRPARAHRARAPDGLLVDLEVRAEQGGRAEVPRRPLHRGQGRRRSSRSSTTSRPSRTRCRSRTSASSPRRTRTSRKGKYTILTTIAEKYTTQHRLSRHDERGDRRDLPEVPDPADVRAGLAGQDERRGLGAAHEHRDQEHLRQVAEAVDALRLCEARGLPDHRAPMASMGARAAGAGRGGRGPGGGPAPGRERCGAGGGVPAAGRAAAGDEREAAALALGRADHRVLPGPGAVLRRPLRQRARRARAGIASTGCTARAASRCRGSGSAATGRSTASPGRTR